MNRIFRVWAGEVETVVPGQSFRARLSDTSDEEADIFATFKLDELPSEDRGRIAVGACFHWTVGEELRDGRWMPFDKIELVCPPSAVLARFATVDEVIAWVDVWQKCHMYVNLGAAKAEPAKQPRKGKEKKC